MQVEVGISVIERAICFFEHPVHSQAEAARLAAKQMSIFSILPGKKVLHLITTLFTCSAASRL